MTLAELLIGAYAWGEANAAPVLAVAVAIPALGTAAAWAAKGGRSEREGRWLASSVVGLGLVAFILGLAGLLVAHLAFDASVLSGNLLLLLAPLACLATALLGVRLVYPLNRLSSVRTFTDVGVFVLALLAVLWFASRFRGWGIVFWGDLVQLAVIGGAGYLVVRRLYRRARGRGR